MTGAGNSIARHGQLAGARVLVVEDDALIGLDLAAVLEAAGCVVLGPLVSVAEALAVLDDQRPDAVLLDLALADGLATPVASLLAGRGVPFALVSGSDGADLDGALAAAPRVTKPYASDEITRTVRRLLR